MSSDPNDNNANRLGRRLLVVRLAGAGAAAAVLVDQAEAAPRLDGALTGPNPVVPVQRATDNDPNDGPGQGRGRRGTTDNDPNDGPGRGRGAARSTTDNDPNDGPGRGRGGRGASDSDPRDAPGRSRAITDNDPNDGPGRGRGR